MGSLLSSLVSDWRHQVERHRNRPFLEATMAACSLVAIADGEITLSERIRVDRIVETLDALQVFDPHEAVDLFNDFTQDILDNPRVGRERAMRALKTVASDPPTASLLIRICLAIAESKGGKSLVSQIEIVMLCSLLDVTPAECGLYIEHSPDALLGQEDSETR